MTDYVGAHFRNGPASAFCFCFILRQFSFRNLFLNRCYTGGYRKIVRDGGGTFVCAGNPSGSLMRIFCAVSALAISGCVHVKTDPIHVEPIQITVDVYVKVDRALEDFFQDLDETSETIEQ